MPGENLLESHESLRSLYDCSTPELDWFVESACSHEGVRGGRLTGAGWGGCAIAAGGDEALRSAGEEISRSYAAVFSIEPAFWITCASHGVAVDTPTY